MPPRPNLPALPDQKEWDAAIAKFSKDPDPRLAANLAMVFEVQLPDPADGSKAYSYKPTTIFRIENGQIAEHWGGGPKGSL